MTTTPARAADDSGPAASARRLLRLHREDAALGSAEGRRVALAELEAALRRHDGPTDLRIRGGLGSGRSAVAELLHTRRGVRATVEDLDELAAPGAPVGVAPDVEVVTLCTAPCRHEQRWLARPRVHPLLLVATQLRPGHPVPGWAAGALRLDTRGTDGPEVDAVLTAVDRALAAVAAVRRARLTAELEVLAAAPATAAVAEAALCSRDSVGPGDGAGDGAGVGAGPLRPEGSR